MLKIEWDIEKNELLKQTRDVCFEDVERAIYEEKVLDIIPHFNQKKYPKQNIIIVKISNFYIMFLL